jgi:hypothetical protein
MITALKVYEDVIKLKAKPNLFMFEDLKNVDDLIDALKSLKPAITLEQSLAYDAGK